MKFFALILAGFTWAGCNNSQTVTQTPSSDSSLKAIDPTGKIQDTAQYRLDTIHPDSIATGVTH
jgi:hypothetical protein